MKSVYCFIFTVLISVFSVSAQSQSEEKKSAWNFSLVSDFVLPAGSDYVSSNFDEGDHFAPVTSMVSGFSNMETFHAERVFPVPFVKDSPNPLLSGAVLKIDLIAEFTLVSLTPKVTVTYQPLPFLFFNAGAYSGAGWNYGSFFQAVGEWNAATREYDKLASFSHYKYGLFASGTFMFDFGAIIPGKWSHVLTMATYTVAYEGLTGMGQGDIWQWQGGGLNANGMVYNAQFIAGYAFPKAVNLLGAIVNLNGHFDSDDYGIYADNFDGNFMTVTVSPIVEFSGEKNTVDILFNISSRRSYKEKVTKEEEMLTATATGREWYFSGVVVSWIHKF